MTKTLTRMYAKRWLPVLKQLEDGLMLVTASNRQADFLRQQYRYYQQQHSQVWQQPIILTDKQWLVSVYQQLLIHHGDNEAPWALLSDQESQLLWEAIIEDNSDNLLDTRRTAKRVRQAANRLEQWLLTDAIETDDSFNWQDETRFFKQWYQQAEESYQKNAWLEHYQLDRWIATRLSVLQSESSNNFLENHPLAALPEKISFVGFQQITPARKLLLDTLREANIKVFELTPEPLDASKREIYRIELADNAEEIKQSAIWAKQQWLENPQLRIGIVLPNLNRDRELTRITFERVFCAAEMIKSDDQVQRPFDISLGLPLSSYPLIDSALMIMKLLSGPVAQEEVIQLLLSPFIFSKEQQHHVIAITTLLRKSRQPHCTLNELSFFSCQIDNEDPSVNNRLQTLNDFDRQGKLTPSAWALKITDLLSQILWSEQRVLSSSEYQCKESWNKKIAQMAIYDHHTDNITWSKFHSLFSRLIRETLFQPQTGDCPIQIMGVLEAAFLTFDKMRVCGIDNRLWPEKVRPSPFIPFELQRQNDMPNATAARELIISKQLLALLSNAAECVIFSHSISNGEESLSVSPLLEPLMQQVVQLDSTYRSPAEQIHQMGKSIEFLDDDLAPKIQAASIKGGSKLLQDIARCQFRAFAHHRLFANAAEQPREGLDPLDRGNLVHKVLEQCWLHLFDKQQLKLQQIHQTGELSAAITPYIDAALKRLQNERHAPLPDLIISIEQRRLQKVLMQWLEMESKRPDFTVKEVEQSVDAPIAGNIIRLQLDRVDILEDGTLAIIDYKTGSVARKNWFGQRPDEPQLPLYAMVLTDQQQTIGALLYGQVKTEECRFIGVADKKSAISGVNKDFKDDPLSTENGTLEQQIIQWRENLQSLLQEYLNGEAAVTPKDEHVCQYCDLHGLCRISELSQRSTEIQA